MSTQLLVAHSLRGWRFRCCSFRQGWKPATSSAGGVSPMAVTLLSVVFRSAKVTLLLRSKRQHSCNEALKVTAIGLTPPAMDMSALRA